MFKIHIPKFTSEMFFVMFFIVFWGQDTLFAYIRAIFLRIPYIKMSADYFIPTLMFGCLILAIPYILQNVCMKDIIFLTGCCEVFFLHMILFPANSAYMLSISGNFIFMILPLYIVGLCLDWEKISKILYWSSVINICTFILYIFITDAEKNMIQNQYSGYIHRAYVLLPQLLIVVGHAFRNTNAWNVSLSVFGSMILLTCGNRGSLVILLVFLLVCLLFLLKKHFKKRVYISIAFIGVAIVCTYQWIIEQLGALILKWGLSPRVLNFLIAGGFFESNGRNETAELLWKMISENYLFGYGLTSDHVITGSYAHNILLEFWMAFGLFVGSILFIYVVYTVAKAWKNNKTDILLVVLICVGFLKLFVSSSFLLEGLFFAMLGYCVALNRRRNLSIRWKEGVV